MREFMEYVQSAFYDATSWSRDNSYSSLNATADGMRRLPISSIADQPALNITRLTQCLL